MGEASIALCQGGVKELFPQLGATKQTMANIPCLWLDGPLAMSGFSVRSTNDPASVASSFARQRSDVSSRNMAHLQNARLSHVRPEQKSMDKATYACNHCSHWAMSERNSIARSSQASFVLESGRKQPDCSFFGCSGCVFQCPEPASISAPPHMFFSRAAFSSILMLRACVPLGSSSLAERSRCPQ